MQKSFLITAFLLAFSLISFAQQLAFPGAEGFGRYTVGGRNGSVYHVTNLNDSGAGSFRDAVSQPNRIVVFDVGGIIRLESVCVVRNNITIAGQTAPGDGITITGQRLAFNSSSGNNIVRYIRVRLPRSVGSNTDAMSISDGPSNFVFDHISVTWGNDGTFDINSSGSDNITLQDCIIGQGADWHGHSTGGLIQCGPISFIRTLFIDNVTRNPKIRFEHEIINSVIYNWAENGLIMGDTDNADSHCNLVGNYFISGPSTTAPGNYVSRPTARYYVYEDDNWLDTDNDGVLNGRELNGASDYKTATVVGTPFNHPGVNNVLSAQEAVQHIIENVGPSLVRDAVDELLIEQLSSYGTKGAIVQDENSNGIPNGGLGTVLNGPKPTDTDNDGMPDAWEDANGLNKNSNDAMVIAANGYANIENYINSINNAFEFLDAPSNLSAIDKTTNSITVKWTNNDNEATKIVFEYSTDASFSNSQELTADATQVTISGLESNTEYNFRIKCENDELTSIYSTVLTAKTLAAAIVPRKSESPSPSLNSTNIYYKNILLEWENSTGDGAGDLTFEVKIGTSSTNLEVVAEDLVETYNYTVTELNPATTYYWQVNATNSLGTTEGDVWAFRTANEIVRELTMYFPFDQSSGTIASDVVDARKAAAINFTPTWATGQKGNAVQFPGSPSNSYMTIPYFNGVYFGVRSFTISLWFKSNGSIADSYFFHKGTHSTDMTNGTGKWVGLQYKQGDRLTFAIDDNSTKSDLNLTGTAATRYFNNQWHNAVCIRDTENDVLQIYMDGVKVGERSDDTGDIGETAAFIIGNANINFDAPYIGAMDEFKLYPAALTSDEILAMYQSVKLAKHSIKDELSATIYPNPFTNKITINVAAFNEKCSVEIYSLKGSLVYKQQNIPANTNNIEINHLEDIPNGIYICKVFSNNKQYFQKLIK